MKRILSIIVGVIIVGAGFGLYYGLSSDGYINPGISILSFDSTSNGFEPNSSAIPVFYAHVDSSKTAEYKLQIDGNLIAQGVVTGKENITFPYSFIQYLFISSALSSQGIHVATFSILYNSFVTSSSIGIFTFPKESFSVTHHYIDVGIQDTVTASNPTDLISINGQYGGSYTFFSSYPGDYNLTYSMTYETYHVTGEAVEIHVFPKPVPTAIYYTDYSYSYGTSYFFLHMNETGGDISGGYISNLSSYRYPLSLNYSIYVNGTFYLTVSNSGYYNFSNAYEYERNISYPMALSGAGPFYVYFIIGDKYYNDTMSNSIEVP